MSTQSAFHCGVQPLLQLLLPGKEADVLSIQPDHDLRERIERLAAKSTEGYVRANKFVATLRREARTMKFGAAA